VSYPFLHGVQDTGLLLAERRGIIDYEDSVDSQTRNYVTGEAAFAVDRHGVIVLWNPAAENLLGYPASSALGQQCWKLLRGHDTFGNQYCSENCLLREIAFRRKSVKGFKVNYKTAFDGRKQFIITCLAVFNDPGKEVLLHICHPEKEYLEEGNDRTNDGPGTLSERETEALVLLADGKSTDEIAAIMHIRVSTVRNHVQKVLRKFGVHNRLDAVLLGKSLDLI